MRQLQLRLQRQEGSVPPPQNISSSASQPPIEPPSMPVRSPPPNMPPPQGMSPSAASPPPPSSSPFPSSSRTTAFPSSLTTTFPRSFLFPSTSFFLSVHHLSSPSHSLPYAWPISSLLKTLCPLPLLPWVKRCRILAWRSAAVRREEQVAKLFGGARQGIHGGWATWSDSEYRAAVQWKC